MTCCINSASLKAPTNPSPGSGVELDGNGLSNDSLFVAVLSERVSYSQFSDSIAKIKCDNLIAKSDNRSIGRRQSSHPVATESFDFLGEAPQRST